MKLTHAFALMMIPFLGLACSVLATWSLRLRDCFFFFIMLCVILTERMDVNFFSQAWYRGTTRGVEISLIEIVAFGLLMGCLIGRRRQGFYRSKWFWPGSLLLMLLYFVYSAVSVVISDPKMFGGFELTKIAGSILVFLAAAMYLRTKREWTIMVVALACAVGFEGLWAVKQKFITHVDRVAGTLDHANSLSMYLCMTGPLMVAMAYGGWSKRLRIFCGLAAGCAAIGVFLTVSRAGIPIFCLVVLATSIVCASWKMTPSRVVTRVGIALLALLLVAVSWAPLSHRYKEATLEEEYFDPTIDGRGIYLRLAGMIAEDHFFGVGLNNWSYHVSRTYGPKLGFKFADYDYLLSLYGTDDYEVWAHSYLAAPAHNLAALTLGELGYPGFLIFTLLWIRWFSLGVPFFFMSRNDPMRAFGIGLFFCIAGIFGQSLTEWVYRQTPINFTFYILLGALAAVAYERKKAKEELEAAPVFEPKPAHSSSEILVLER